MIELNTRVIAQGRYLGTIHDAVEVKKDGHRTWAYQIEYRHGLPKTAHEEQARTKSQDAFIAYSIRFEREKAIAGDTAWNAFNAYTGWSQNDRSFWKDPAKESERRTHSKLFGSDADRSVSALMTALSL